MCASENESTWARYNIKALLQRYLKIHFTAFQCGLSRLDMNVLIVLNAWAMLGHVHIIAYIKLPQTEI
jgi:hypothetical protein